MHVGINTDTQRSQRFMLGPQELESQITISYLVWVLGTKLLLSEKVVSALDY